MKLHTILKLSILLVLPLITSNENVSSSIHWKSIFLKNRISNSQCRITSGECPKTTPYNTTKNPEKADSNTTNVNNTEKETPQPEKAFESFDEWTKKRRDDIANNQNGHQKNINESKPNGAVRWEEPAAASVIGPTRNFASKECGAKVIASNAEAENAKAVVNEKDIDDYMRNPCESAKEKFVVIELCEAIQVKKISIGNFELFASRPKQISVLISERYPPLSNWISLGTFQLQDLHKNLQTFEVIQSNVYAKFIKINFEEHFGKEHYCIVSVVNVIGSTLADEYEKEEEAVHRLNTLAENNGGVQIETVVTTPSPSEQTMQTQLPKPPQSTKNKSIIVVNGLNFRDIHNQCLQCVIRRVSHLVCHVFVLKPKITTSKQPILDLNLSNSSKNENYRVKNDFLNWANRNQHQLSHEHSRRKNVANIQRYLTLLHPTVINKNFEEVKHSTKIAPPSEPSQTFAPSPATTKIDEKPSSKESKPSEEVESKKQGKTTETAPVTPIKQEPIIPAGGSTSQREMVLMKLSKRISAVEMNLTLSTEYLSELSKQYVSQMSGYQQELKETKRVSRENVKVVDSLLRTKITSFRREIKELRHSIFLLQQMENGRYKQSEYDITRSTFLPSCHITSIQPPPQPKLARLSQIIPSNDNNSTRIIDEKWRQLLQNAKSAIFGSATWNTDHFIVALISFNITSFAVLFAAVLYIYRRNRNTCEEMKNEMKCEMKQISEKLEWSNRRMILKGMRKAELAVTATVCSKLRNRRSSQTRKAMMKLETALSSVFSAQQTRMEEHFEENQKLLKQLFSSEDRQKLFNDTFSIEDSESSSETETHKDDTPISDM